MRTFCYFGSKILLHNHHKWSHFDRLINICNEDMQITKKWNVPIIYKPNFNQWFQSLPHRLASPSKSQSDGCALRPRHRESCQRGQHRAPRRAGRMVKDPDDAQMDTVSEWPGSGGVLITALCPESQTPWKRCGAEKLHFPLQYICTANRYVPFFLKAITLLRHLTKLTNLMPCFSFPYFS